MENDAVDLWATDEVHFQQHGSRCRMGVPPETRDALLLHHPTRRGIGYFGAVRLRDGKFRFSREAGRFSAMSFLAFLKMLRHASIRTGRRVVVIVDNAKYHHTRLHKEWRENHVADFRLEYLPPYSPELNPIERVWKLTRRQCIHNRYFPTLQEVVTTEETQFAYWANGNETLRRPCAIT
jgi:transposase